MNFDAFDCLTFDCYGTLIDWESGILDALQPILAGHGLTVKDEGVLTIFGELESAVEAKTYRLYRKVLAEVVDDMGKTLGFKPSAEERDSLAESIKEWPTFADTVDALEALKGSYRLAVISNIDDDLFGQSAQKLGVEFDEVVTAQQVRSYKPSSVNFSTAFQRLGHGPDGILHVAQSLYHDIGPARELGLSCVWVNRRAGKMGPGATTMTRGVEPDLEVANLKALTMLMGLS